MTHRCRVNNISQRVLAHGCRVRGAGNGALADRCGISRIGQRSFSESGRAGGICLREGANRRRKRCRADRRYARLGLCADRGRADIAAARSVVERAARVCGTADDRICRAGIDCGGSSGNEYFAV